MVLHELIPLNLINRKLGQHDFFPGTKSSINQGLGVFGMKKGFINFGQTFIFPATLVCYSTLDEVVCNAHVHLCVGGDVLGSFDKNCAVLGPRPFFPHFYDLKTCTV